MMIMGGSATRVLMIIALGYIMVAHIAVASGAEEANNPLLPASELVLKGFGPSGYTELPGITRVKPFWRGRKLLAACGVGDVQVLIQMMGLESGSNHYSIEINWDPCTNSNCRMSNIHVYCPGFETVDVSPSIFRHTSGTDCVVNNGGSLGWRARIRMTYVCNIDAPRMHATQATVTNC